MREIYKINITAIDPEASDDNSTAIPLVFFDQNTKCVTNQLAYLKSRNFEVTKKSVLNILSAHVHPHSSILHDNSTPVVATIKNDIRLESEESKSEEEEITLLKKLRFKGLGNQI